MLPNAEGAPPSPPTPKSQLPDEDQITDVNTRIDKFTNLPYLYPRPLPSHFPQGFTDAEIKMMRNWALDGQYLPTEKKRILDYIESLIEPEPIIPIDEQVPITQTVISVIENYNYGPLRAFLRPNALAAIKISITRFFNFMNSEWQGRQTYLGKVIKSGGSLKSPQYLKIKNEKEIIEGLILAVNDYIATQT